VAGFADTLNAVAARLPHVRMLVIMGTDGIPVDRYVREPDASLEAIAAEYTTLLRTSLTAAHDTGLGALREVTVVNDALTALLVAITPEYFLFAALAPGARVGEARYVLRLAGYRLEPEFA
jgi:predicted regulator of Ras-like GTPase activity (Roadblock/LC7/MglB family)